MGTLNSSYHENGGVILYSGEYILLYCDAVTCDVEAKGSAKGRIYLTTHRFVFTAQPLHQNHNLKSLSAPFFYMFDLCLEQPVFSANYIKGKVRCEPNPGQTFFAFKLKFGKGGAIEFGQAMTIAARQLTSSQSQFQAPPSYASATSYYEAPQSVYQPDYPVGFAVPSHMFPQPPPVGFVFMSQAPPPYPGLTTLVSQHQDQNNPNQYIATPTSNIGFVAPTPGYPPQPGYTPQSNYPTQPGYPPQAGFAQPGYPQAGYPPQGVYPPTSSFPSQQSGYPSSQSGFPPQPPAYTPEVGAYPATTPQVPSYPSVYPSVPSAEPSVPPYYSGTKKSN